MLIVYVKVIEMIGNVSYDDKSKSTNGDIEKDNFL